MIKSLYSCFQHWSEKGSIFIISDPHFEDSDCKLMDPNWISAKEQIEILKKYAHKTDTLIILGDIGNVEYIKELKCYKVLIMGNHDTGASNYLRIKKQIITSSDLEFMKELKSEGKIDYIETKNNNEYIGWKDNRLFDEVYEGPLIISEKIILSHEPLPLINFWFNIHGHDHSGRMYNDPYHTNVAANIVKYTPINLGDLIKSGCLSKIDNIHRITIDKASEKPLHKKSRS